jgi:hypothetical protein
MSNQFNSVVLDSMMECALNTLFRPVREKFFGKGFRYDYLESPEFIEFLKLEDPKLFKLATTFNENPSAKDDMNEFFKFILEANLGQSLQPKLMRAECRLVALASCNSGCVPQQMPTMNQEFEDENLDDMYG